MLPSRILIATNGSPSANAAEEFAAEMAAAQHASSVVVITVLRELVARGTVVTPLGAEIEQADRLVTSAAERIRATIADASIPVEAKVIQSVEEAGAFVAEAHATGVCSHIVMGRHGRPEVAELLLGSTTHDVLQKAHCPVTIVAS